MTVEEASQSARFPLKVRALSVNGGATQGTIQAVINVTYTYAWAGEKRYEESDNRVDDAADGRLVV